MQYKYIDDVYIQISVGLTELESLMKDIEELRDAKNKNPELFANNWTRSSLTKLKDLHKECAGKAKNHLGIYE